jgi:UDP-GlcNAc:undecaprenyl-phosphate GlcNAc-1-phosphate transferase
MILLILTFTLALLLALYGVPLARRAALKYGIVDRPDGHLKHQREAIPYLGGLAIYLAFLVSLAFTFEFRQDVLGIILAGTLMVMLGLIDDFGVLSVGTKLLGQLLAIFVLIKSGIRIEIAAFPEWLDLLLTVIWMLGLTNAFNLLDIMDGLAAGVGLICTSFLLVVSLLNDNLTIAFMVTALAGSLLGFLRYNFPPARIYMGDCGALFIGMMVGALSMIGQYGGRHQVALLTPLFILGVPIFDTLFVMYVRASRGLPVLKGSSDHLVLRLKRWGMGVPHIVTVMYVASVGMGAIGLAIMSVHETVALIGVGVTAVSLLVALPVLRRLDGVEPAVATAQPAGTAAPRMVARMQKVQA